MRVAGGLGNQVHWLELQQHADPRIGGNQRET